MTNKNVSASNAAHQNIRIQSEFLPDYPVLDCLSFRDSMNMSVFLKTGLCDEKRLTYRVKTES